MKKRMQILILLVVFFVIAFSVGFTQKASSADVKKVESPLAEIESYKSGTKKADPPVVFNCPNQEKWMCWCPCISCCEE
jgi:hypothetical protein